MANSPLAFKAKFATIAPVSGLRATTCAPSSPWPFFVTRPVIPPVEVNWSVAG